RPHEKALAQSDTLCLSSEASLLGHRAGGLAWRDLYHWPFSPWSAQLLRHRWERRCFHYSEPRVCKLEAGNRNDARVNLAPAGRQAQWDRWRVAQRPERVPAPPSFFANIHFRG